MNKGKYLGLDFGDKRVGIAITDESRQVVFPRDFLETENQAELIEKIKDICTQESIQKIILGLPLEMDGKVGDRARLTQAFGDALQAALPEIPVETIDERLTTKHAQKKLQQTGMKAREQKNYQDSLAAQLILEMALQKGV